MAAETTTSKIAVTMKLNDGTTESGATRTVSVGLGSLDKNNFNADKVLSVIGLLLQCLSKSLYSIQKTETSIITESV